MKNKKVIKKIFIFLIIIIITIFLIKNLSKNNQFEDILFLKLFSKTDTNTYINKELKSNNQFILDVSYKNTQLKDINLLKMQDKETMVYEKIAPGTSGNFSIILKSNKTSKYNIILKSKNEKPSNLKFSAYSDGKVISSQKTNIEELSNDLNGLIETYETKIIIINWFWDYDGNERQDFQDTKDSKNIKQYKFDIYAYGEEI